MNAADDSVSTSTASASVDDERIKQTSLFFLIKFFCKKSYLKVDVIRDRNTRCARFVAIRRTDIITGCCRVAVATPFFGGPSLTIYSLRVGGAEIA